MRRAAIILAAVLLLTAAAWTGGPRLLRRVAFFRVHQIEVSGTRYLADSAVVHRLNLRPAASVFDPLAPVQAAAAAIPGVLRATVTRRLPGTLRIAIVEAAPVALTNVDDRLVLMDDRGRLLPFDPIRAPTSLPVAVRDSATAALLGRLLLADSSWYGAVQTAWPDHGDVLLKGDGHLFRLRPDADAETMRSVSAVREYLASHAIPWQQLDARFSGRVFVRKGSA